MHTWRRLYENLQTCNWLISSFRGRNASAFVHNWVCHLVSLANCIYCPSLLWIVMIKRLQFSLHELDFLSYFQHFRIMFLPNHILILFFCIFRSMSYIKSLFQIFDNFMRLNFHSLLRQAFDNFLAIWTFNFKFFLNLLDLVHKSADLLSHNIFGVLKHFKPRVKLNIADQSLFILFLDIFVLLFLIS